MPPSPYVLSIREKIGNRLLMLPSVAVMMFDPEGRVLLAKESQSGHWMTIGGAIDPHELPAEAAVREAFEETGLHIEPVRLIGVFGGPNASVKYANGDHVVYTAIAFEARVLEGEPKPDGVEALELRYFAERETSALELRPHTRDIVTQSFKRGAPPYFAPARRRPK